MNKSKYFRLQVFMCIILDFLLAFTISDKPDEIFILKGYFLYIPYILWGIMFVFFIMETKFKTGFVRMVYLILTTGYMIFINEYLEYTLIYLLYFIVGYTFLLLVVLVTSKKDKKSKISILPVGRLSKKHHILTNLMILGLIILIGSLYYILKEIINLPTIISALISLVIVYAIVLCINFLINPLARAIKKFNKDINFNEFENTLTKLISERQLHPDSRNYLRLFYTNYMFLYDLDAALSYFEKIKVPTHKLYKRSYDLVSVLYSINKKDKEEAYSKYEMFKNKYPKHKYIKIFERTLKVVFTVDEIPNINELYSINKGNNIHKIINAHLLMYYYKTRNNPIEAKVYASYILANANDLAYLKREAEEVVNH